MFVIQLYSAVGHENISSADVKICMRIKQRCWWYGILRMYDLFSKILHILSCPHSHAYCPLLPSMHNVVIILVNARVLLINWSKEQVVTIDGVCDCYVRLLIVPEKKKRKTMFKSIFGSPVSSNRLPETLEMATEHLIKSCYMHSHNAHTHNMNRHNKTERKYLLKYMYVFFYLPVLRIIFHLVENIHVRSG